jgi:hypothetical protein
MRLLLIHRATYCEHRIKFPTWRNGSVIVLHAIGGGSIPPEGTKIGMLQSLV